MEENSLPDFIFTKLYLVQNRLILVLCTFQVFVLLLALTKPTFSITNLEALSNRSLFHLAGKNMTEEKIYEFIYLKSLHPHLIFTTKHD